MKKKKQVPKAYVCYEIAYEADHPDTAIKTLYNVHVAVPSDLSNPKAIKAANKQAMKRADDWIRKWNNTDESIKFFLEKHHPRYYFKEFEIGKDFFLYDLQAAPPRGKAG